jgi:cytochrome c biogenesis protein CcdA
MIPAAVVLGVLTSVGSCCNYPTWVAVAGYAASGKAAGWKRSLFLTLGFVLGATLLLGLAGGVLGSLGEAVGRSTRMAATLVAGLGAVVFGLVALELVPFRLPAPRIAARVPDGLAGALVFGAAVAGASTLCSASCGPGLGVALGLAAATRDGARGAIVLASFGLGYGLPFAAVLAGLSLGRSLELAHRFAGPMQKAAGCVLLGAGFWMLTSAL